MEIKTVFVLGAGIMGRGIAQVIAECGLQVVLSDVTQEIAAKGLAGIANSLQKRVDKDELTAEQRDAILGRIHPTDSLAPAAEAQLVVEAIKEDLKLKQAAFAELDHLCSPAVLLASNTSALRISDLAAVTAYPERVVGIHFFNPVPRMRPVEIIRGAQTADNVVQAAKEFVARLQKTPIEVRESPGFVVNRLLIPMINEAAFLLHEGIATREAIDAVMELGAGHPTGPLALADYIGLDVILSIMETLERGFGDPKYRPCPLLRQRVAEGKLGRKTGEGFYTYPKK
jgi:3-hydroxybutyryl-CoA dehydrogenase